MHDLKFPGELFLKILPLHPDAALKVAIGTPFLSAAAAFKENLEQIRLLMQLPEFLIRATASEVFLDVEASYAVLNDPLPKRALLPEELDKFRKKRLQLLVAKGDAVTTDEINNSTALLTRLCSLNQGHEHVLIGVEALLIAMLLQTWTAFESFITDVWVAALNLHPKKFAKRAAGAKPTAGSQAQEKSVRFSLLERFDFDLTKKMGLVMKDRFDFKSYRNIESAYIAAFGDDAKQFFDASVSEVGNMIALEAVRNVYAHRAGKSDLPFREAIGKAVGSPYYSMRTLADGEKVCADAVMVREFFLSACTQTERILAWVKTKI